ncbi:hypothetical protein ABI59_20470 [Acidobacteria bacterium Mor1]|nr:hypothetical protein ABI59_20470 [Acidobacteria bacterium Mor1]
MTVGGGPLAGDIVMLYPDRINDFAATAEAARSALGELPEGSRLRSFTVPREEQQARRAIAESPEVVLAVGSTAVRVALDAGAGGEHIPLVYAMVFRPEALNLSESAQPRVTGVSMEVPASIQFARIKQLLPETRKIGVLYNPAETQEAVVEAREAAERLDMKLVTITVRSPGEVEKKARLLAPQVDVIWAMPDPTVLNAATAKRLILFSLRARKPLIAPSQGYVKRGALCAMTADPRSVGEASGRMMRQVLDGDGMPAPEEPAELKSYVNRKSAELLGLDLDDEDYSNFQGVFPE